MFDTINDIKQAALKQISPDQQASDMAQERQAQLTKPQGSLGKLEEIAIWLAGWQRVEKPKLDKVDTLIFAGNHGVAARGVSLFPAEVTVQMVGNFEAGGAAINQLCKLNGANLKVMAIDLDNPTADFTQAPAMSEAEFIVAVNIGANAVSDNADMITLGEMGIANTTSASAIALALFGGVASDWTGRGTGLENDAVNKKAEIVAEAVEFHQEYKNDPIEILRRLGGRELAAIFGATLAARAKNIPILLDGFICCAAIAPLFALNKDALSIAVAGHQSQEQAHAKLLQVIELEPLLTMDMRLGEGSGAAVALNIVRAAIATHNGMATFAEAAVSNKD
ncbi:MAG: nicotinate-nucleotide--dimethylbenzimidazole phosphoribosyltransferase [OCS116 cluster bacterium]|uniref:Nicotinate-nucleotide--dimethylbenzimidazole phosphoribosyltransferase n=1 Tax=OCS116 cluster bacterium TaxID=2030921 RepID=A0A2A4YUS5_9PROT|nr:nicotinate-nucleotide--dimethylbenzimidazole phosphoribosyltransferase [OCS116 cluster bacterium]